MTSQAFPFAAPPPDVAIAAPSTDAPMLTHVELHWHEKQREDWLKFGKPVASRIIDRHIRVESYSPGQVFALVRWASNEHGTIRSSLDIVSAVASGNPHARNRRHSLQRRQCSKPSNIARTALAGPAARPR